MPEKGPQLSQALRRIEGRAEGNLRRGRTFPLTTIDLTNVTDTETTGFPIGGYQRGSVSLQAATIGTAVIEIEGSVEGGVWEPLSPRLRMKANVMRELDFNVTAYSHLRGRVVTADVAASDNAIIALSVYY